MKWQDLKTELELDQLIRDSATIPQVIFKYSSRCSISDVARNRLEREAVAGEIIFHFLDLIRYRTLSNEIEKRFGIRHESPQVLLIRNGKCIYDESHLSVNMKDILQHSVAA